MKKKNVISIIKKDTYLKELIPEIKNTDHKIKKYDGILRWVVDPAFKNIDLNKATANFINRGITKNDEEWRDLYRKIGYSLYGYWEIFYWEANNPDAEEYIPKTTRVKKDVVI